METQEILICYLTIYTLQGVAVDEIAYKTSAHRFHCYGTLGALVNKLKVERKIKFCIKKNFFFSFSLFVKSSISLICDISFLGIFVIYLMIHYYTIVASIQMIEI